MSSVYMEHSKCVSRNRHKMREHPATIYWVIHMKFKELAITILFGALLPLFLFLIAETWHGPLQTPQQPTTDETIISETQPETTVLGQ